MLLLAKFSVQWDNRKIEDPVINSLLSVEYLIPYSTLNGVKQLVSFVTALLISKGFMMELSEGFPPGSQAGVGPGSSPVAQEVPFGLSHGEGNRSSRSIPLGIVYGRIIWVTLEYTERGDGGVFLFF